MTMSQLAGKTTSSVLEAMQESACCDSAEEALTLALGIARANSFAVSSATAKWEERRHIFPCFNTTFRRETS